jgi:hypothetical protein
MADPFDYVGSRADADELIGDFGATVTIRRMVASGPAWEPVLTPTDYDTLAVRIEFTQKQIATRTVLATDTRWLVAAGPLVALGIEPGVNDELVVGGAVVGKVLQNDPLNPAGVAVLFDCHVRV